MLRKTSMIMSKLSMRRVGRKLVQRRLVSSIPATGSASNALEQHPFHYPKTCFHSFPFPIRSFSSSSSRDMSPKDPEASNHHGPMACSTLLDFFGEPITFFSSDTRSKVTTNATATTDNAMAATDAFLLAVVSKGISSIGGGEEAGIDLKPAHSVALSWAEQLRHAAVWNMPRHSKDIKSKSAPMLAVISVAPLLAQAGVSYVKHLDTLLEQATPGARGLPPINLFELAETAIEQMDHPDLDDREVLHLEALQVLLEDDHKTALAIVLKILRLCPGDVLALSLAMDLSLTNGDKESALRASGSAAAYWNERQGGIITPALTGHALGSAYIALGFAVAGRHDVAEPMADRAMKDQRKLTGAVATWVQALVYDASGRIAEGISATANFDGVANYEGAGLFFFDSRLGGYGARFSLDREERGRGRSAALRLYERHIERVLDYSGFSQGQAWHRPMHMAPLAWSEPTLLEQGELTNDEPATSWWDKVTGKNDSTKAKEEDYFEIILKDGRVPSTKIENWEPALEDVLTWLPPTPLLLTDATLLLLRFTLNGTISSRNIRWENMRSSWKVMLEMHEKHAGSSRALAFCPLASLASSLLFPPGKTGGDEIGNGQLALALYNMGEALRLGNPVTEEEKSTSIREIVADRDPNFWLPVSDESRELWQRIVGHFEAALDGYDDLEPSETDAPRRAKQHLCFNAWDFEARPVLEHATVYAACKAGDTESLSLARSICSQGVTLRPNAPEEWWRYSIVLGLLGDEVGSENALNNSINIGGGQGARRSTG